MMLLIALVRLDTDAVRLKPDTTGIPPTDMTDDSFPHNGSVRLQPDRSDVDRGKQIYMKVGCYQCHGREAQGASTGPRLGPDPLPLAQFARYVRTPRNDMPPYTAKVLSEGDLAAVYAYVSSRPPAARGNRGDGGNGVTQRNGATEKK
jgi:cytochrome c553